MRKLARLVTVDTGAANDGILLSDSRFAELAVGATSVRLRKGEALYRAGEPAALLYQITYGGIRTLMPLPQGGRAVTAFHAAGDVIGLISADRYTETAEATAPTLVRAVPHESLDLLLRTSPAAASRLIALAAAELAAKAQQVALLSRGDALGRIALFVRAMAEETRAAGQPGKEVRLWMSRTDIARYVGLSTEAVSRGFRALSERGIILFRSRRRLDLLDPEQLDEIIANGGRKKRS